MKPEVVSDTLVSVSPVQFNCNSTISLQTAIAWIETPTQDQFVRCLLDGGSFIQENSSRSLSLPIIGEETHNLHIFATATSKLIKYRRVPVRLRNIKTDQNIVLQLLYIETQNVCTSKLQIRTSERYWKPKDVNWQTCRFEAWRPRNKCCLFGLVVSHR